MSYVGGFTASIELIQEPGSPVPCYHVHARVKDREEWREVYRFARVIGMRGQIQLMILRGGLAVVAPLLRFDQGRDPLRVPLGFAMRTLRSTRLYRDLRPAIRGMGFAWHRGATVLMTRSEAVAVLRDHAEHYDADIPF